MKKVFSLPAEQGNVPLFKDKLSWFQIADLVMKWIGMMKKTDTGPRDKIFRNKLRKNLKSIRSMKTALVVIVFGLTYLRHRTKKLFGK